MTPDRENLRADFRRRFDQDRGELLPALHHIQHRFGYLPDLALEVLGWHLGIPASEVYGAATSYTELRTERPGDHVIRVCTGLSCTVSGAPRIMDAFESETGLESGGTSRDGAFTLETTACGFLCALAPAVEVDGRWEGRVNPESVASIVGRAAAR